MSGSAQLFPVVGSSLTLPNPLPTQDKADGTPGSTAPTLALQVAGSDGTDLQVLATDTEGHLQPTLPVDVVATGTIAANAHGVSIATNGAAEVVFNVTGTWSGTLQPQYQLADGSWVAGSVLPTLPSGVAVSSITGNGQWKTAVGGYMGFRLESTAWTSGTATVHLEASQSQTFIGANIKGNTGATIDAAPGAAVPTNAVMVGGSDGTNLRAIATDTSGRIVESSAGLTLNSTGQVSVASSATLISAASATQAGVLITNPSTTITVYLGGSGVTTSTGAILAPGTSMTIPTVSAVYGIVATGTQTVSFLSLTE